MLPCVMARVVIRIPKIVPDTVSQWNRHRGRPPCTAKAPGGPGEPRRARPSSASVLRRGSCSRIVPSRHHARSSCPRDAAPRGASSCRRVRLPESYSPDVSVASVVFKR